VIRENEKRNIPVNEEHHDESREAEINEFKKESFIWPDQAVILFLETKKLILLRV